MNKEEVSKILNEIAQMLELKGENPFKVRAYQNASRAVASQPEEIGELIESGKIDSIKGVGESIKEKIIELYKTGRLNYYEELKKTIPEGLIEMLKIPSLGPKRIKVLYEKLNITTPGELEYACNENRLVTLDGFGEKLQENILKGINYIKHFKDRFLFAEAKKIADDFVSYLKENNKGNIQKIEVAGSLRRRKEIIKDIDILCSAKDIEKIMNDFVNYPEVKDILSKGITRSSVRVKSGVQVDLRAIKDIEFPYALAYFTGSKEHNIALRTRAKKMGIKVNEYGLFTDDDKIIKCNDENEFFKAMNLSYIEPELRENLGEIECAEKGTLPKLVSYGAVKGVFHIHTNYSDGGLSIEDVANEAMKLGYKYIGISDHSKSAGYAHGLSYDDIKRQVEEIDKLNKKYRKFRILKGIEVDILRDGKLDYPDDILALFDFTIVAIHSSFNMAEEEMTDRIIKAMKNKYTSMLAHPTGRLLLSREGYKVDIQKIIKAAKEYDVIIEINSHPQRLDLDWRYIKQAKEQQIIFSINPDIHNLDGLQDIEYGIGIARKGWLEEKDIISCWDVEKALEYLKQKRK